MTLPHQLVPTFSYKKETRIQGNSVKGLTKQRRSYLLDRYVVLKLRQTCAFLVNSLVPAHIFFNVFVISFQYLPLACQAGLFISHISHIICISSKETSEASVLYCSLSSETGPVKWLLISDCVLETTSGIAQTWMKSFLKQIIKGNVEPWQLNVNFKLYNFLQIPSPRGRAGDFLAFEYQLYFISICLLMKQCSLTGWNPSGTDKAVYL